MKYITCGEPPIDLGKIELVNKEMMFFLYLPVKKKGYVNHFVPKRLKWTIPAIERLMFKDPSKYIDSYLYITAKTMFVCEGSPGNRPGWHIDGFGSKGDLNFIWADMNPTEFAIQKFSKISSDDKQSMIDIENQIDDNRIITYPDKHLLRLDESVVHRVAPNPKAGIRTFLKLTLSEHEFRNEGNSKNYMLNMNWDMKPRNLERNLDHHG